MSAAPFAAVPARLGRLPLVLAGFLAAAPLAAEPLVRAVTLSSAGLAMIEAEGRLGGEPLRLSVARDDIDDLLKSLWLSDPAGAPARLSMTGPGAFEDTFARLPFRPEAVTDPARLLAAMIGAPLVVERRGERWQGVVTGITQRPCEGGVCPVLGLRLEDGTLRQFDLDTALSFAFAETADAEAVAAGLAAWRAASSERRIEISILSDNSEDRPVAMFWLQSAPVWRTAWRAVDTPEGLRLVGWAMVENATGLDWLDVRLTLATGATRNIAANLYARRYAAREDADLLQPVVEPATMRTLGAAMAPAPAPMRPESAPALAVEADEGASFSRFTLEAPVSLPAGGMVSLPFLSELLPDARLTLYRGGSGAAHPQIALELENPLPLRLPAGVLTLYEEGRGHAGDAMIPELAPGARATVEFARDTAMRVQEESHSRETIRQMRLVRGVLEVTEDIERRTTYRIEGAPAAERVLTLDHPRRETWAVTGPSGGEERLDAWRWRIAVPAGAIVSHDVTERQPRLRRVAVMDIDLPTLAAWESRAEDPALRATLQELAALRRQITEAESAARRAGDDIAALEREQTRLVNLIVQLGDDSAANRERRARVDAIDAEIAALSAERRDLAVRIEGLRARIADILAN